MTESRARLGCHVVVGLLHEAASVARSPARLGSEDVGPALDLAGRYFAESAAAGDFATADLYAAAAQVLSRLVDARADKGVIIR